MLTRIQKSMNEKDAGFTLIELLVVIIIIGILAAIAIPIFLNQRKKGIDASMKSDVKTAATSMESIYTSAQTYPASTANTAGAAFVLGSGATAETVQVSPGNQITITTDNAGRLGTFCIVAVNPNGTQNWVYISDKGGLQPASVTACA